MKEVAEEFHCSINEKAMDRVIKGLKKNFKKYGNYYCPCKLAKTEENICPCEEFRCTKHCHCGVFKPNE